MKRLRFDKTYTNGNYSVVMFTDGTKVRLLKTEDPKETFEADFPESIDIKLTNKCPFGCSYCHENSIADANIDENKILKNLEDVGLFGPAYRYYELALGGGALSSLRLGFFTDIIRRLGENTIIVNATINQKELANKTFMNVITAMLLRYDLKGLGISLTDIHNTTEMNTLKVLVKRFNTRIVVHTIYGITTEEDYKFLIELGVKNILVLGYKTFRRGEKYKEQNIDNIKVNQKNFNNNLEYYSKNFNRISFDNLAVKQIDLKSKISEEEWNDLYMGDDGRFSMYIDIDSGTYALNSTAPLDKRYPLIRNSEDPIREMFKDIKLKNNK